jgi:Reverse transcriptase (RNA-dependent DNA polymerase)
MTVRVVNAYVRSKQRTKVTVGPLKNQSGEIITDNKIAADVMNKYFASVFTVEDLMNIPEPVKILKSNSELDILKDIDIREQDVRSKLESLKVNKSPGPDDIHPKLLYELRNELVSPLTNMFNISIKSGEIPQDWKDANVSPLFKKGSKNKPENYRPVSLTSIIGKMLESIVKDHIVNHLNKFNLIKSSQHGFTKGRSCLTNLLEFFETVTKELDQGNSVDLIYLDFAKAFDKVPYMRLFKKLESHGINGKVSEWVKNWLCGRRQKVSISKESSGWLDVTSGVPQGSVLGPVLFIIYINDLETDLISKIGKFADDTKMSKCVNNLLDAEILSNDLRKLDEWAKNWQMQFNKDKCVVMHIGRLNNQ